MPLMALLVGCACSDDDALSPVLTIEGGQIQGVRAENPDVYVFTLSSSTKTGNTLASSRAPTPSPPTAVNAWVNIEHINKPLSLINFSTTCKHIEFNVFFN